MAWISTVLLILSYIPYFSSHSTDIKTSIISSQFLRAYRVCDLQFIDIEIQNIFKDLGYPKNFIEKSHLKARRYFVLSNRKKFNENKNKIITLSLN